MIPNLNKNVVLEGADLDVSLWKIWWNHLRRLNKIYLIGIFATFLTGIAEVMTPVFMGKTIDQLLHNSKNNSSLVNLALIFLGLLVLQYLGRMGWRVTIAQQAHHLGALMKSKLWDRIRYLPEEKITTELRAGEVMNLATADVNLARFCFSFTLVMLADLIFLSLLGVGSMMQIHWKLTLLTLLPAFFLPRMLLKLARSEATQYEKAQESLSSLSDLAARCVETLRLQRLNSTGKNWRLALEEKAVAYVQLKATYIRTSLMFYPLMSGSAVACYAIGITMGIHEVFAGRMSSGQFITFQSLIFVVQTPLQELGFVISDWQRSFASLKRLTGAWRESEVPGLRSGGVSAPIHVAAQKEAHQHLQIKDLCYSPPGQSRDLFRQLNVDIHSGQHLGITGPIGSGKSTLFKILLGLEQNYQGQITLSGLDIRNISHRSLTQDLVLVPQRPFLFSASIRDNLKLDLEVTESEMEKALEIVEISQDIKRLPKGLDTHLGEWGVNLSGGQKQRLALARGLVRKPQVLLLDDCLSAVDTSTEERILRNLKEHLSCTVLWVAHRESTLRSCSKVIHLNPTNPPSSSETLSS